MTKIKFLYLLVALLIATNVGLLTFMYSHRPPHPPKGEGPKNRIAQKLNFSQEQIKKYDVFIKEHQSSIRKIESKIRTSKNNLYATLKAEESTKKDSIIDKLGSLQKEIETAHFSHFTKIKTLCTNEQKSLFDELTNELGKLFAKHPPKKK